MDSRPLPLAAHPGFGGYNVFGIALTIAYTVLLAYILCRAKSMPVIERRLSCKGFE